MSKMISCMYCFYLVKEDWPREHVMAALDIGAADIAEARCLAIMHKVMSPEEIEGRKL